MTKEEIEAVLTRALDKFVERDKHLLAVDVNERSMSHRIATYLADEIRDYDVDCEYNRDGFNVKQLHLGERRASDHDEEAVTVFPDIIVHRRGNNDYNLLVIEMKKATAMTGSDYDREKLRAFRRELNYTWAAHLIIGRDRNGGLVKCVEWI